MSKQLVTPRNLSPKHAGLQFVLLGFLLASAACRPDGLNTHSHISPVPPHWTTEGAPAVVKATNTPTTRNTATSSPTPQPLTVCAPPRWLDAVAQSVETFSKPILAEHWNVKDCVDPAAEIAQGLAHMALVSGDEGVLVGSIPLALVVPFGSSQVSLTLEQAQQVQDQGSSVIETLDWMDVSPDQTVLRVDGAHPTDPDYPLQQPWSVTAAAGFEDTAAELAQALAAAISGDAAVQLAAVGDVMLDRRLGDMIASGWVEYPFENVSALLSSADLTVGNLESALGDVGSAADKGYTFQAPPQAAQTRDRDCRRRGRRDRGAHALHHRDQRLEACVSGVCGCASRVERLRHALLGRDPHAGGSGLG